MPFVDERDHLGKLHDTQETARLYKNRESAQVDYNIGLHQLFLQSDIFNNMSPNLMDAEATQEPQITERVSLQPSSNPFLVRPKAHELPPTGRCGPKHETTEGCRR